MPDKWKELGCTRVLSEICLDSGELEAILERGDEMFKARGWYNGEYFSSCAAWKLEGWELWRAYENLAF